MRRPAAGARAVRAIARRNGHPVHVAKRQWLPFRSGLSVLDPEAGPSSIDLLRSPFAFTQTDEFSDPMQGG